MMYHQYIYRRNLGTIVASTMKVVGQSSLHTIQAADTVVTLACVIKEILVIATIPVQLHRQGHTPSVASLQAANFPTTHMHTYTSQCPMLGNLLIFGPIVYVKAAIAFNREHQST